MNFQCRMIDAADHSAVAAFALTDPHPDYAAYRHYGLDFASEWQRARVSAVLKDERNLAVVAQRDSHIVGFASIKRLAFETMHFGIPMAQIEFLIAQGQAKERDQINACLIKEIEHVAREAGILHLLLRVNVLNLQALSAAQANGYRVMDTVVTYLGRSRPADPNGVSRRFPKLRSEARVGGTLADLPPADLEHFVEFMRKAYRYDRFHADVRLPSEQADQLYVEWFRRVFRGEWATGAQLVYAGDRLVGFCSFQETPGIRQNHGVVIIGRGLAAVLPEGRGAYALLVENISTQCPVGSDFQEFDTQIQNVAVINVWVRSGMPYLRAQHTLHRWLDE